VEKTKAAAEGCLRIWFALGKNPRDFAPHFLLRPVRVLRTEPRRFHFARRPAQLFRQREAAFGRHPAVNRELFGTGLLIRQHGKIMRQKNGSRKRGAGDGEYMKSFFGQSALKTKAGSREKLKDSFFYIRQFAFPIAG
jgi:hypothetical protein